MQETPPIAAAFHIIHFHWFLEEAEPWSEPLESMIQEARSNPTPEILPALESNED